MVRVSGRTHRWKTESHDPPVLRCLDCGTRCSGNPNNIRLTCEQVQQRWAHLKCPMCGYVWPLPAERVPRVV